MNRYIQMFFFIGIACIFGCEGKGVLNSTQNIPAPDIDTRFFFQKNDLKNLKSDTAAPCKYPLVLTNIWLIGDSTVASGSGWGDFLTDFVTKVKIYNLAQGGASAKSFYKMEANINGWKGNEKSVLNNISAGDYVFIQFGHNDRSSEPVKHTKPGVAPAYKGSYRDYLDLYIKETRANGGVPILITPVSTMYFMSNGSPKRIHIEYSFAMHRIGLDRSVPVLDLELRSSKLFDELGEDETLKRFGGFEGDKDRTHFLPEKAPGITKLVADLILEANIPLSCHIL